MANDASAYTHQEWIGYVQPVGVVVSTSALLQAGAAINRNFIPLHKSFLGVLPQDRDGNPIPELSDFPRFATEVLGWRPEDLTRPDDSLTIPISGYEDGLRPNYAVKDGSTTLLLIGIVKSEFDADPTPEPRHWNAAPQMRFERLLRETGIPAGLLVSPAAIRLVYAPKGESSGHITFKMADMIQVAGRPILAALHMLVSADRLFTLAEDQRLPALLAISRRHQNLVSTQLSGQVMEALFDLLRGFQAAHDQTGILGEVLQNDPNQVYAGLLTVLMRLVFVLYAEDRGMLSSDETYLNNYSVGGLFERLREDQAHHPDTMDQRYGAWARLLALFRLVNRGAQHGKMRIPGRKGYLFDPDRYPFLEGRPDARAEHIQIPRLADGVLYRVLTRLLVLSGERLSYRNLDVEQIGSVYEAMMGFELHVAEGPSIAIKPKKRSGAPVTINLAELLALVGVKRNEWLNRQTDQKVTGQVERDLKAAGSIDDLLAALDRRIAKNVTPTIVPAGAMIFQPSPERRRSGSHYTPRSLTQPIVESALAPVLAKLGAKPRPEQILALKVCDPAMGSGAFLVESCRQLGNALVEAWHNHNEGPPLPPDEDEVLHARRIVAQQCLYGVDKNEMAADLAKLSLWLATLARDHEFTFLNHALRHGDSLTGLTARQIAAFDWDPAPESSFLEQDLRERIARVAHYRKKILSAREDTPYAQLSQQLDMAEQEMQMGRMAGDLLISAFFDGDKKSRREQTRLKYEAQLKAYLSEKTNIQTGVDLDTVCRLMRKQKQQLIPFHWHIEFPEVFDLDEHLRALGGFDVMVGNPPFLGGTRISQEFGMRYFEWLTFAYFPAGHLCDIVAYFFRRSFDLLNKGGCFGLIATNTICQGDTREGGLVPLIKQGGQIYSAVRRMSWPGEAAVVVSHVHARKNDHTTPVRLDGKLVPRISAFLLNGTTDESPARLAENPYFSSGSKIYGQGFLFDDTDPSANPVSLMNELISSCPQNAARILPYIGGEEVNSSPTQSAQRHVIFLSDLKEEDDLAPWPGLAAVVRERVKPERDLLGNNPNNVPLKRRWWAYQAHRPELYSRIGPRVRALVNCQVSGHLAFAFLPTNWVFAHTLNVFDIESYCGFGVLQSRPHELWARLFTATLKDDLRYSPSDCYQNFPLPDNYESDQGLYLSAKEYYECRAEMMRRCDEGLTKIYNRFHRPDDCSPDVEALRRLHHLMDRAVLDSYGWFDIAPVCLFFPEFGDEEDDGVEPSRTRQRKYRYRWADEVHDEVLARLLALNLYRAGRQKDAAPDALDVISPKRRRQPTVPEHQSDLF